MMGYFETKDPVTGLTIPCYLQHHSDGSLTVFNFVTKGAYDLNGVFHDDVVITMSGHVFDDEKQAPPANPLQA